MSRTALGLALSGLLALAGCATRQGAAPPGPAEPSYELFKNTGVLPVKGVPAGDPGPRVFASITSVPRLKAFLDAQGLPETLEVLEPKGEPLRIELNYTARDRRIVVERVEGRLSAYAPTRLDGSPLGGSAGGSSRPGEAAPTPPEGEEEEGPVEATPEPTVAPEDLPMPTELQALECPIDPERADCVRLCVPGAHYEWCRELP